MPVDLTTEGRLIFSDVEKATLNFISKTVTNKGLFTIFETINVSHLILTFCGCSNIHPHNLCLSEKSYFIKWSFKNKSALQNAKFSCAYPFS